MSFRLIALAIALPIAALAQSKADPADPKSPVPPLRYESAVAGYKPHKEEKPAPWKQVNEAVKPRAEPGAAKADSAKPQPAKPPEHRH